MSQSNKNLAGIRKRDLTHRNVGSGHWTTWREGINLELSLIKNLKLHVDALLKNYYKYIYKKEIQLFFIQKNFIKIFKHIYRVESARVCARCLSRINIKKPCDFRRVFIGRVRSFHVENQRTNRT